MMRIIDREMQSKVITTEKGETTLDCQASFNSDGYITLRNYTIENKDSDEIIILSGEETQAIIKLFKNLAKSFRCEALPF